MCWSDVQFKSLGKSKDKLVKKKNDVAILGFEFGIGTWQEANDFKKSIVCDKEGRIRFDVKIFWNILYISFVCQSAIQVIL